MSRPTLNPESPTIRINLTVPASEAEAWRNHARRAGDDGNISRMVRRLVRRDMEREAAESPRGKSRKKSGPAS